MIVVFGILLPSPVECVALTMYLLVLSWNVSLLMKLDRLIEWDFLTEAHYALYRSVTYLRTLIGLNVVFFLLAITVSWWMTFLVSMVTTGICLASTLYYYPDNA